MAKVALRVGDFNVGIRVSTSDVATRLRSDLADIVVCDAGVPANYSVRSEKRSSSEGIERYRIFAGCKHVFTTKSLHRAIAVLVGYLHDFLPQTPLQAPYVRMVGLALIHGHEAILIPWQLRHRSPSLEQILAGDDIRLLESTTVLVDTDRQQLVVPPWSVAAAPLPTGAPRAFFAERTPPGRYKLRAWCATPRQSGHELSPALAVAHGMTIAHHHGLPRDTLRSLATLVAELPVLPMSSPSDIIELVGTVWSDAPGSDTE